MVRQRKTIPSCLSVSVEKKKGEVMMSEVHLKLHFDGMNEGHCYFMIEIIKKNERTEGPSTI